ncbi:hypothetical protein IGI37_003741 [Enterococcus sp. AZ194]|uniref:TetR/AcrR family transcriptional regulator n=1 Tax=Enterococcus sp. AZ194 TaxID=2774629 RepID=UPI003F1ED0EE
MRETQYTAAVILEGAYKLAIKHGVSQLSARSVSREIGISTQPIYIAFRNMDELKEAVLQLIFSNIRNTWFSQNDSLGAYIENLSAFLREDTVVYLSLITDRETFEQTQCFFYQLFLDGVKDEKWAHKSYALAYGHILGALTACLNMKVYPEEEELVQSVYNQIQKIYGVLTE